MTKFLRIALFAMALIPIHGNWKLTAQDATHEDLRNLMDEVFPGNANITIDGAYTTVDEPLCLEIVPFDVPSRYRLPQGYIQPQDIGPEAHPMFADVLVHDSSDDEIVLPTEIIVAAIEPDQNSEDLLPIMQNASSPEINTPRAAVGIEVVHGESLSDAEPFRRNPIGDVLFSSDETQGGGFVDIRRIAFDFTVENSSGENLQVRGSIHDVIISWSLTYSDLRNGQSSLLVLSGIAYAVTEPNKVWVESRTVDGELQYTVHTETIAVLKDAADSMPVPLNVNFTAIQDDNDAPFGGEILGFEIVVDDVLQENFTTQVKRSFPVLWFVRDGNLISGDARLAFSDGCGDYLQMDLLFRDIPLNEPVDG